MNSRLLKSAILALLVLSLLTARPQTINAHNAGSTFQAWASTPPTIDGNIDQNEWNSAAAIEFDFGGGYTGTFYAMNDENNLYIAVKVVDDNFNTDPFPDADTLAIFFDNNNNGVHPEAGDEYLYIGEEGFHDGFISGASTLDWDVDDGGTQDGSGAVIGGVIEVTAKNCFEFAHPLDTTDNTHDFSLSTGSTVGFMITYYDGDGTGDVGAWPSGDPTQFGDIVIASSPPTLTAYTATPPTIDGDIDTIAEWASADTASMVFGWTYTGTVYVMNDDENLYIGAKIADSDLTANDFLVLMFDNNNDGEGREDGDDHLQLLGQTDFQDNFYQESSLAFDTSDGGTKDGDAKANGDGSFNYYEFKHPLDSTDNTHDFSLSLGSTVGFNLQYRDDTKNYWGDWPSHTSASWAKITISGSPNFTIAADPSSLTIAKGTSQASTVNITSLYGFSDAVTLTHSWFGDTPTDVTISLPGSVTPPAGDSATSTLQITTADTTSTGTFTLRVTGSSGSISLYTDVTIEITEAATTTTTTETTATATTTTPTLTETTTTTPTTTPTATTTTTSELTTTFTAAPVPGFPPASILIGLLIAIITLMMIRRAKT